MRKGQFHPRLRTVPRQCCVPTQEVTLVRTSCREDFEADGVVDQWREHPWDKAFDDPGLWQNTSYWHNQARKLPLSRA